MKRNGFRLLFFMVLILTALMVIPGCAATKKNPYVAKRKTNSHVSTSQLGRNRYFFSTQYQKKLNRDRKR